MPKKTSVISPALSELMHRLNDPKKGYGPGTVVLGSEIVVPDRITTGSLALDVALGGGWPANQWHEIIGNPSDGKTTLVNHTIAANQEADPNFTTLWIASEYYDASKAAMDGVDNDRVIVVNENLTERCFSVVLEAMETKQVDAIVIDSLPAMAPGEEAEKTMEEFSMALNAKLTNKFFRKQGTVGKRSMLGDERPCTGFLINQWRSKIGVMYGDPRTTPGGVGKDFACVTRVVVNRDEWIDYGTGNAKQRVGQTIKVRTLKNKSFPPQRVATIDYYFQDAAGHRGGEYDSFKEVITLGIAFDVITAKGSWYSYGRVTAQGADGFGRALAADLDTYDVLRKEVFGAATNLGNKEVLVEDEDVLVAVDTPPASKAKTVARRPRTST